jgi:hypothetical protein
MAASHIKQIAVRAIFVLLLMFALFVVASPVWSSLRSEVNQFHDFLQNHPRVSAELRTNPNLVNSKRYLDKHDDLAVFMRHHPDVKRELVNHPSRVFGNYYRIKPARMSHHR